MSHTGDSRPGSALLTSDVTDDPQNITELLVLSILSCKMTQKGERERRNSLGLGSYLEWTHELTTSLSEALKCVISGITVLILLKPKVTHL